MNILFTSVGIRSYLVNYFKADIPDCLILTSDCDPYAPGNFHSENYFVVPEISNPDYISTLLKICEQNNVDLLIPLHDNDLLHLSEKTREFEKIGTRILISPLETILLCNDKYETYLFLRKEDIATPSTYDDFKSIKSELKKGKIKFPIVIKPRTGSGSTGFQVVYDMKILERFLSSKELIAQEYLDGQEYGVDLLFDFDANIKSIYIKKKLKMRSGETDKAITVKNDLIQKTILRISNKIKFVGPCDIDVFVKNGVCTIMEINPRFGGGYPLSHMAGAAFPSKIGKMVKQESLSPSLDYNYKEGIIMMKELAFLFKDDKKI